MIMNQEQFCYELKNLIISELFPLAVFVYNTNYDPYSKINHEPKYQSCGVVSEITRWHELVLLLNHFKHILHVYLDD